MCLKSRLYGTIKLVVHVLGKMEAPKCLCLGRILHTHVIQIEPEVVTAILLTPSCLITACGQYLPWLLITNCYGCNCCSPHSYSTVCVEVCICSALWRVHCCSVNLYLSCYASYPKKALRQATHTI